MRLLPRRRVGRTGKGWRLSLKKRNKRKAGRKCPVGPNKSGAKRRQAMVWFVRKYRLPVGPVPVCGLVAVWLNRRSGMNKKKNDGWSGDDPQPKGGGRADRVLVPYSQFVTRYCNAIGPCEGHSRACTKWPENDQR